MNIQQILESLKKLAVKSNFKGYDPYDGLYTESNIGKVLSKNSFGRLLLIHFNKKMPINLRRYLGIRKNINPKTLALYLSGIIKINQMNDAVRLKEELLNIKIEYNKKSTWGYYFPWQSRIFYLPKNTPTIVATSFVANALMDYYEISNEIDLLKTVESSISFILYDLNVFENESGICFSYSPFDKSVIYNASALGLELLARYLNLTGNSDNELLKLLEKGVNFIKEEQNNDGSWYYGKQKIQYFIDHYHTAYLLESLENIRKYTNDKYNLYPSIKKGLDFYLNNFFTHVFAPKFYKNSVYPIESHCSGAAIKALCTLSETFGKELFEVAIKVTQWTTNNLFDLEGGFFYYQKNRFWKNKINYMRWSQAWMFIGLSYLIYYGKKYGIKID